MRRIALGILLLNALLLPLSAVPCLFLVNSVNPMKLVFITEFTVKNAMDKQILVTPIGTVGKAGARHSLPMARTKLPWTPLAQRGRFRIAPGETRAFLYDWDDINFSEIVVETDDGRVGQLVVDPDPTARQYHTPPQSAFTVSNPTDLSPVDARVWSACIDARVPSTVLRALPWLAIPAVTILPVFLWFWRLKRAPEVSETSAATDAKAT